MIEFSQKQKDLICAPYEHTLEVCEGSPRSGKTFAATARFALHIIGSRDTNHLVVAYSAEQAYRLIFEGDGFGLNHIFKGSCRLSHDDEGAHLIVNCPNGTKKIYWKGGGKADSHKTITGMSLGSVYFCEINLLHMDMIQECFRRTYAARDRFHIADLNPPPPRHPVITEVFDIQDTKWTHWTCIDNPVLTGERLEEIKQACSKSPFLFKRDWLGERCIPQGVIYFMFDSVKHIWNYVPNNLSPVELFFTGDGGTTDATSIGCYLVCDRAGMFTGRHDYVLLRVGNWYYDRADMAMSDQAKHIVGEFMPYMRKKFGMRESGILIDPACKALRLEIDKLGVLTGKADNNAHDIKGSSKGLKVGIEMAQSMINDGRFYCIDDDIYDVSPFLTEIGLYCVDDNGNPIDSYNHAMDEFRYASNYFLKQYSLWG